MQCIDFTDCTLRSKICCINCSDLILVLNSAHTLLTAESFKMGMIKILVLIFKVNVGVETAESSKQVLWRKYNSHNKIYSTDCAESICTMYTYLRFFASPFRVQTESFQSCSL